MKDNTALLDFLASVGMKSSGDLVQLVPADSFTKEIERSTRTMVVTISTRARDRAGDVVEPKGVRLERYLKNPVVLWAHDYSQRPLAKSLWIRVKDGSVVAKPRFHDSTDLAREVFQLYAEGYLNAWSIGFIPEDWKEQGEGFRITKWDLLEYSAVPIPANPEALTLALKEKRITSPLLCKALGAALPDLVPHQVRPRDGGTVAAPPKELELELYDASRQDRAVDPSSAAAALPLRRVELTAPARPGISADISRKIAQIVREEVRGEIRRLRGSLDLHTKEKGK